MQEKEKPTETSHWQVVATVEKFKGDFKDSHEVAAKGIKPYATIRGKGNLLLNEGMDAALNLLTGQGAETVYSNANARIGVGNGTTAAARTQTALQGASTAFAAMDATFPTAPAENDAGTGRSVKFKSTFGSAAGNFAWEEWTVDNGSVPNKNLNRKVQSFGTKSSGETWILTVEISLS